MLSLSSPCIDARLSLTHTHYHILTCFPFVHIEAMHAAPYFVVDHFPRFHLFLAVSQDIEPAFFSGPSDFGDSFCFSKLSRFSSTLIAVQLPAPFQSRLTVAILLCLGHILNPEQAAAKPDDFTKTASSAEFERLLMRSLEAGHGQTYVHTYMIPIDINNVNIDGMLQLSDQR